MWFNRLFFSRLGFNRLHFEPYTQQQLQCIVSSRLDGLEVFQSDEIQLVSRKVGRDDTARFQEGRGRYILYLRMQGGTIQLQEGREERNIATGR